MTDEQDKLEPLSIDPIQALKSTLDDVDKLGKEIAEQGRQRTEYGQETADLASGLSLVIDTLPPGVAAPDIENTIEDWRFTANRLRAERDSYVRTSVLPLSASGTGTISSTNMLNALQTTLPVNRYPQFYQAKQYFDQVVTRTADKEKALMLIRELRLDKPFRDKVSVAEQFETAYDALNRPVTGEIDPANTSLLPMRAAIDTALEHLLFLRPNRINLDAADGNKDWRRVRAIAAQLKRDFIQDFQVQNWARDLVRLQDEILSPSKQKTIRRDAWVSAINVATIWIISFLSGLDPAKLRKD